MLAILTHQNLPKLAKTPNDADGKKAIGAPMGFLPLTSTRFITPASPWPWWWPTRWSAPSYAAALLHVSYAAEQPIASYDRPQSPAF